MYIMLLTFTAASHKVLVQSTEAWMYCVVALRQTVELTYQTFVNDVPQVNTLDTHQSLQSNDDVNQLQSTW